MCWKWKIEGWVFWPRAATADATPPQTPYHTIHCPTPPPSCRTLFILLVRRRLWNFREFMSTWEQAPSPKAALFPLTTPSFSPGRLCWPNINFNLNNNSYTSRKVYLFLSSYPQALFLIPHIWEHISRQLLRNEKCMLNDSTWIFFKCLVDWRAWSWERGGNILMRHAVFFGFFFSPHS